jgi:hypothetical protein
MSSSAPAAGKPAIDISKLRYILATDCGSTTTKLLGKFDSSFEILK